MIRCLKICFFGKTVFSLPLTNNFVSRQICYSCIKNISVLVQNSWTKVKRKKRRNKKKDKNFLTMFDKQLCNYPLEKVLEALGAKRGTVKDMWYSPFRNEDDASLHVDRQKNVWYDHGAGVGGTNVKLVMLTLRCNKFEAEKFIASLSPALQPTESRNRNVLKGASTTSSPSGATTWPAIWKSARSPSIWPSFTARKPRSTTLKTAGTTSL